MRQNNTGKTCLTMLLILFICPAFAQGLVIGGKVIDNIIRQGLPEATIYVTNLNSFSTDSLVTNSSGCWEFELLPTGIKELPPAPIQFTVSQNYPNPFNPSTKINFVIPEASAVTVTVFNSLGQVVDKQEKFLPAGIHSILWTSKGSAGVYFFNARSKFGSITKKMTQLDGGSGAGLSGFQAGEQPDQLLKTGTTIPVRMITIKFGYVPDTFKTEVQGGEYFERFMETIHSASLLADLHNDILEKMIEDPSYHLSDFHHYNHTDIPRLILGGVDLQMFVVWVDPSSHLQNSFFYAQQMINLFKTEVSFNTEHIGQAYTAKEAYLKIKEKKIAGVIGVEGGHAIENELTKLITLYEEGMRYLTITWNNSLDWAVSAQDQRSATVGLSEFGKKVIRTLDSLGVIIDVSHVGIKTIEDILATTKNPIIASHSGVRSLRNHYRNLYDSQIVAIANSGGVIGVVFYPPFLSTTGWADIKKVAEHIDYIVNLVGIDYAAVGSDFDGIGNNTVDGLEDVSKFPNLTVELLRRGYSRADIEKINGGNFMRVFQQVCGD